MKPGAEKPEDQGNKVPAWVVSFTDMITLLLAFFVLLQAFSTFRDPEMFFMGQGSFRRAIAGLGVPDLLFGKRARPNYEHRKNLHPTEPDKEQRYRSRVLDAQDEQIRKIFSDLKRSLETKASDLVEEPIHIMPTPIRFAPGQAVLDAPARKYLGELAIRLGQSLRSEAVKVYVVALAADVEDRQQQWVLSAHRAQAAAKLLESAPSARVRDAGWQIDAWGAGPGDRVRRKFGLIPEHSYVLVAVVGAGYQNGG